MAPVHTVFLAGRQHFFSLTDEEAVTYQLHDKIEDLIDGFSNENLLKFFQDFVRASYRVRTATGNRADDEEAVKFLHSQAFEELATIILVENSDPEESLADFISSTTRSKHGQPKTHNIFDERND